MLSSHWEKIEVPLTAQVPGPFCKLGTDGPLLFMVETCRTGWEDEFNKIFISTVCHDWFGKTISIHVERHIARHKQNDSLLSR